MPIPLATVELIRLLVADPEDVFEVEAWELAIKGLRGRGLLRLDGRVVAPTMAAVSFAELVDVP